MNLTVRPAENADIFRLVALYGTMESEQTERKPIWALTDGLDERFDMSLFHAISSDESWVFVGEIDGATVGFIWATIDDMLDRADGQRIGKVRLIYTEPEARGVGVGHEMLETVLAELRSLGLRLFDAPVGPGQRAAKNFFESHGFAARSIIMHHADPVGDDA
ncbi:MAG: GNAT family N-acetyltransferase [Acidimicrobiia bacterium]